MLSRFRHGGADHLNKCPRDARVPRHSLPERAGGPQVDSPSQLGRPRAETHQRTQRSRTDLSCWTLPSRRHGSPLAQSRCGRRRRCPPPAARSPRGPQPMAKSWGRAGSTGLRTLPALPAPPDDALPPLLFIRACRLSRRLGALRCGRRGGRGAARPRRRARRMGPPLSASPPSPPQARSLARDWNPGAPRLPAPTLGIPPRRRTSSERPGQRRGETDRQRPPPSPSSPTQLARAHKGRRGTPALRAESAPRA